jgi:4-hydroxy-tetrahydrodipicolinate reductase
MQLRQGIMKIILSGYGKMGRLIERQAMESGHSIAAIIDPMIEKTQSELGSAIFKTLEGFEKQHGLPDICIAIDFTSPNAVIANIHDFAGKKIPLVVGTTGWYDKLDDVKDLIERNQSSLLWAANFSLGVNLFYRIAAYCAALFDPYPEYDVAGYEAHHNQKMDSPSGTAKVIADLVLKNMERKSKLVWDKLDHPPEPDEIHFASLRAGAIPGIHALLFDSPADSIEIKHTVRSREGLAAGALSAAEWLAKATEAGKCGIFTIDDVLGPR